MPTNYEHGGWYKGRQYNAQTGSFGTPGQIVVGPSAGSMVSKEVNRQSSLAQGLAGDAIENYLKTVSGGQSGNSVPASPKPGSLSSPTAGPTAYTPTYDFVSQAYDQLINRDSQLAKQQQSAQQRLIDFYNNLEAPQSRFTRIRQEQGVPQQEELVNRLGRQVMDLQDVIGGIDENVTARSGDFFMNEASRDALATKERAPHEENLVELLRQKEREEIGLQGKEQLVQNLLNLSIQGDELRAEPLRLGVDYNREERDIARQILSDMIGSKTSALEADTSRNFQLRRDEADRQFTLKRDEADRAFDREMKDRARGEEDEDMIDSVWQDAIANAETEYDVWQYINVNQDWLRSQGVNIDELWRRHKSLAERVGTGGRLRRERDDGKMSETDKLIRDLEQ